MKKLLLQLKRKLCKHQFITIDYWEFCIKCGKNELEDHLSKRVSTIEDLTDLPF